jgi:hypothetical protein
MDEVRRRPLRYFAGVIGVFAVLIVCGYLVIVVLEPFGHEAVSFETPSTCTASGTKGMHGNKVTSEWNDGTLTIRTSICSNCADHLERVSAQVFGSRVLLNIRTAPSKAGVHAACDCEHSLIVRLAQLPQRDFQIMGIPMYRYCE